MDRFIDPDFDWLLDDDGNAEREWDESEHPRDEDGKFTVGGGGDGDSGEVSHLVSDALRPLEDAGFKVITASQLPAKIREELKVKEPKVISEHHSVLGKSFAKALDHIGGTSMEGMKGVLDKIEVAYADYEPHGASMTTVTGDGHAVFLINTSNDPTEPITKRIPGNYAASVALREYDKTGDMKAAVATIGRLSALHEFAHMANRASEERLVGSFMDTLILFGVAKDMRTLGKYLHDNLSGYALESPDEAMAEAVCKYINEGTLPKPLDVWADVMVKKQR